MNQTDREIVLRCEDLWVKFDTVDGVTEAVRGVSFELKRGRTLAIVGESGSGKSVSAYALMRIIQDPGRITDGRISMYPKDEPPLDITALSERDERLYQLRGGKISMIFQEPMTALSPVHTIGNQIREAILIHQDKTRAEADDLAAEMLDKVGIPDPRQRLTQYPFEFSGGMRQRVVIAMALVCRPEILIADEPTTALDVTIQAHILELINELKDEMGTSVIFITHDLGVVAQVADEVVVMNQGLIMETGTVREIFHEPLHPYTKRLLGAMPRVEQDDAYQQRIQDAGAEIIAALPAGHSLHPPGEDYRADAPHHLHEFAPGRRLLLWAHAQEVTA